MGFVTRLANYARRQREKPQLSIYDRGFYDGYAAGLIAVEEAIEKGEAP